MTDRDWTPKRKGAIYCAPACGGNCTWAAFQKAKKDAAALAKECGPGYTARVHENLGWHFSATHSSGYCTVYGDGKDFQAYIGPNQPGGRWVGHGKTAKDAISAGLGLAAAEANELNHLVAAMVTVA